MRRAYVVVGVAVGLAAAAASIAWRREAHSPMPSAPEPSAPDRSTDVVTRCGIDGREACDATRAVPGGRSRRAFDGQACSDDRFEAHVSAFHLDRFEVTVGRFRRFLEARAPVRSSPPSVGDGAHPRIAQSGWRAAWDAELAGDATELRAQLDCGPGATWTDDPSADARPINCVTWFEAFAFCAWDGGRLPTEAEWNHAAAGGAEQRARAWSADPQSANLRSHAVHGELAPERVGSCSPAGDARWGHADLIGNVWEWTLDSSAGDAILPDEGADLCSTAGLPLPCDDCASVEPSAARVLRGAGFGMPARGMMVAIRRADEPRERAPVWGIRCARDTSDRAGAPGPTTAAPDAPSLPATSARRPLPPPDELRPGDVLPAYELRALRAGDESADDTLESVLLRELGATLLVVYTCAWSPHATAFAADLGTHRDALRARGVEPVLILADGATRGQPADGIDLATFARAHRVTYVTAIDRAGEAGDACARAMLVSGEPARVDRVDDGPAAVATSVAAALAR